MDANDTFWQRLRRRKLFQWTLAYVTAAAAVFGTLESVGDVFDWGTGVMRAVFFLLLSGLMATVVVAWYHGERGRQRVGPSEALLLALAAVLGLAGAAYSLASGGGPDGPASSAGPSVLVLPFTETGGPPDEAYLGEGIAEEVRRALSLVQGAPVARGSSAGGPDESAVAHGGFTHVLAGTVRRAPSGLLISARLSDDTGRELWTERYETAAGELFEVERRIALAVADRLVPGAREARADRAPGALTVDPAAHDHYLRGEHALRRRSPASVVQAISEYRAASSLDPGMTAAIAREAYAYGLFVDWGWTYPGLSREELMRRGVELSDRAVAQDSLSAEAWLARAYLIQLDDPQELGRAADAFGRAVALDPTNPEAQHQYGQTLMALGRYAEAKAAYHAALAVEPERPLTLVPLSAIALREGDVSAARRWADSAIALARDAPYAWASRSQLRLGLGDAEGARSDAERALGIDPSYELPAQSALAAALAALGEGEAADAALERARRALVRPEAPSTTEAYYLAIALLRMGRRGDALDVIENARPRGGHLWFYLEHPAFDDVRDDPRFRRIVAAADPRTARSRPR